MTVRWLVLQLLWLSLSACTSGQQVWIAQPHDSFASWHDRNGDHPNLPAARRSRHQSKRPKSGGVEKSAIEDRSAIEREEAELDMLPKYSHEWVALRKQIDSEEDARIAKIVLICRGCETPGSEPSQTASSGR
jgi:hypothetical protein